MTNKEKAALLAAGMSGLAFYETGLDKALNDKKFDLAWDYQCQYNGAAHMLNDLGLWSYEECSARSAALLNRYLAARVPGYHPKEDA